MKKTNLFIGLFLSVSTLFAQEITEPTLIKEASTNPMDIPYEKWEMRMHRRIININADDKAIRQLMRLKIPDDVYIELSLI